jgi:phosphatidylglycerophosphatase C
MTPVSVTLAAFDVDHTLTKRDCVLPFLLRVAGWPGMIGIGFRLAPLGIGYLLRRKRRDDVKAALAVAVFSGRSVDEIDRLAEGFAQQTFDRWMRPDTLARLRWHQGQGHAVTLVSASFATYLRPLARLLDVPDVLATELAHSSTGQLTGALDGPNCRGAEKVARLQTQYPLRPAVVWAYGDSAGDTEMLAWADHACLVTKHPLPLAPTDVVV